MDMDPQFRVSREDDINVDFYSELMNNYFPESSIKTGHDIRSLMIARERPAIFCLDTDDRLQAIIRKEGSLAGWIRLRLSAGNVKSFEIEFDQEEASFRIAKVEDNKVWVSQELDLEDTDFDTLDTQIQWTSMQADSAAEQIDKVSIGVEHVLFTAIAPGQDAVYYVADFERHQPKKYTLPEHTSDIVHFELGSFQYTNGVFLLYRIGRGQSLLYQSFPDPKYNKVLGARFKFDESIRCFALLEDDDGNDIVYAAGTRVHEAVTRDDNSHSITTLPGEQGDIHKIRVAGNDDERSVWTLDDNGLHYRTNRFFDQEKQAYEIGRWMRPILMVDGADQFSCLKGHDVTNQLFTVSTRHGSELTRLWQDRVTSMWNRHRVTISETDSLKSVESYTAHITFKVDSATKTFAGQKVRISADSNIFVYINNRSHHIGPDREADVELGIVPEITVICPVSDIASARLVLKADFLKDAIGINLTDKVLERLQEKVTCGDDLKELAGDGVNQDTLNKAADGIQELVGMAAELPDQESTVLPAPGQRQSARFSVGVSASGLAATATTPNALFEPGMTIGDVFNTLLQKAREIEVIDYIVTAVEDGIRFTIRIGEEIFNWVVKTLREIGGFIQKIFESIKVFFEDLFKFLAFLFDWNAILDTKNAFKGYVNEAIAGLKGELGNIRAFIDRTLEAEIAKFDPDVEIPNELSAIDMTQTPKQHSADPRANWLNSKKELISDGREKSPLEQMPSDLSGVLQNFITDIGPIVQELGDTMSRHIEAIFEKFKGVLNGKVAFIDFLKELMRRFAAMGLKLLKQLMDVILVSLQSLLDVAYVGLNKEWHIPLISDIYREISGGDALTFLDVICLFVAIPTTILYKIGEGEAPFTDRKSKETFIQSGRTVFQLT